MKMMYEKPVMDVERFQANEFFAACGDKGEIYNFQCDAPKGTLYRFTRFDGTLDGVNSKFSPYVIVQLLGGIGYHPCNEPHVVDMDKDPGRTMFDGFVDYNGNLWPDKGEEVIVWLGENGRNGHATRELDISKWETAKS